MPLAQYDGRNRFSSAAGLPCCGYEAEATPKAMLGRAAPYVEALPKTGMEGPKVGPEDFSAQDLTEIANTAFDPGPIQELMRKLGCNQRQFARILGTSNVNVSHWLKGVAPRADFYFKMAAAAKKAGFKFNPVSGVELAEDRPMVVPRRAAM